MTIIQGRGRNRRIVMEIPHTSIIKRSEDQQQRQFIGLVCDILGVQNKS